MWREFGHVTLEISSQQNPQSPPIGGLELTVEDAAPKGGLPLGSVEHVVAHGQIPHQVQRRRGRRRLWGGAASKMRVDGRCGVSNAGRWTVWCVSTACRWTVWRQQSDSWDDVVKSRTRCSDAEVVDACGAARRQKCV